MRSPCSPHSSVSGMRISRRPCKRLMSSCACCRTTSVRIWSSVRATVPRLSVCAAGFDTRWVTSLLSCHRNSSSSRRTTRSAARNSSASPPCSRVPLRLPFVRAGSSTSRCSHAWRRSAGGRRRSRPCVAAPFRSGPTSAARSSVRPITCVPSANVGCSCAPIRSSVVANDHNRWRRLRSN